MRVYHWRENEMAGSSIPMWIVCRFVLNKINILRHKKNKSKNDRQNQARLNYFTITS